ncbi:unnamed protein product [Rotaria sp. Silwood2]|nr:unnamed protein product [Rotaria sp. Silwood2]CAF2843908.1 unnamed protein product [Rotaria sp. Silwood2]
MINRDSSKLLTDGSTTQKISNKRSSTAQVNNRTIREQQSRIDSHNYSPMTQLKTGQISHSHNHGQPTLSNSRIASSHDSLKYVILPQEQVSGKAKYTTQRLSDELDTFNHNLSLQLNVKQKSQSHNIVHQTVNSFQSIQYPLEELLKGSLERYPRQQTSVVSDTNSSDMELINIRHILNLIEQDYLHAAQPYVSSVQFTKNYEDDQLLADLGSTTVATVQIGSFSLLILRKNYDSFSIEDHTRLSESTYNRQVPAHQYSDTNGFMLYKKMHSQNSFTSDQHSTANRRKHRTRHHVQASPSISKKNIKSTLLLCSYLDVSQPSNTVDTQSQTDSE